MVDVDKEMPEQTPADDGGGELGIGERLRRAREAKGMSLEDVAARTRIPQRHLASIDRGDWDALPAVTYAVGFARTYAKTVDLDGAAIGRELRDQLGATRPQVQPAEYYEPADPARVPPRTIAIIAAVLAVVIVAAYLIWRGGVDEEPQGTDVPIAEAPAPRPAAPAPQPLRPQAVAGQPVTLTATEEVWLRIDAEGRSGSLFQGILNAGDRYQIPADARNPVVRTGRPQVLRVTIGERDVGTIAPSEQTVSGVSLRAEDLLARIRGTAPATR